MRSPTRLLIPAMIVATCILEGAVSASPRYEPVILPVNERYDAFDDGNQGFNDYFVTNPQVYAVAPGVPFVVRHKTADQLHVTSTMIDGPDSIPIPITSANVDAIYMLGTGTWLSGGVLGHGPIWCDSSTHFGFELKYADLSADTVFPTMLSTGLEQWGDLFYGPPGFPGVQAGSFPASPIGYFHVYQLIPDNSKFLTEVVMHDYTSRADGNFGDYTIMAMTLAFEDRDLDRVRDDLDNCPWTPNPLQQDTDADGIGDLCEMIVPGTELYVYLFSPVDAVVIDPYDDSIGIGFNTIAAGSSYDTTTDLNSPELDGPDGDPDDIITIANPAAGPYRIRVVAEDGVPDSAKFTLSIRIDGNQLSVPEGYLVAAVSALGSTLPDTLTYMVAPTLPGDVNADGQFTSADIIYLVNYVFKGGPEPVIPTHGDVNCTVQTTSSDIIYMVGFVFKSGPPPCSRSGG